MANTAALLGNLLCTNADINFYTQQQIYWANKYEANAAKLSKQVKYEEKWVNAYDDALDPEKSISFNGIDLKKGEMTNRTEAIAEQYAEYKVEEYDEVYSLELADLDIEYDTMKCMYDTLLEEMRAQQESEKSATSSAAQDTGLLGQG